MNVRAVMRLVAVLAAAALANPANAWPDGDCKLSAERHATVEVAGAKSIVIRVGAGDLNIRGQRQGAKVSARGRACAPSQALLDQTNVQVVRDGDVVRVSSQIPAGAKPAISNWWSSGDPYIDMVVDLPAEIPITLQDSSGDITVSHVAAASIRDSSGDLEVVDVGGNLDLIDSSGDIRIGDVRGGLMLEDSSGDINLRNVKGNVMIKMDGSGDINITDAGADVGIDSDGSGDVDIDGVAGSFTLGSKGSGDVRTHAVRGKVSIPDDKR